MNMSFVDRKPWVVTQEDVKKSWNSVPNGKAFKCSLCNHRFIVGDTARWECTNDVPGAGGNPLICFDCDRPKEEIVQKMIELNKIVRVVEKFNKTRHLGDLSCLIIKEK